MSGDNQSAVQQAEGNGPPTEAGGHAAGSGGSAGSEPPTPGSSGWTLSHRRFANRIIAAVRPPGA